MKLNTSTWQEFKLSELFDMQNVFFNNKPETVSLAKGDGIIPFLGATAENNGVTDYCDIESIRSSSRTGERDDTLSGKIFDGNCITITNNGSVCHAYYQDKNFTCSHDQTICVPKFELDSLIAMFICSVINKERYKWSYGRKLHDLKKAKNIVIKLPVNCNPDNTPFIDKTKTYSSNGYVPDWQFMQEYIKSLHHKPITTKIKNNITKKLAVDNWEEFMVSDLFDSIYKAKAYTKEEVVEVDKGLNFVSRTDSNNGVDILVDKSAPYDGLEVANCITIGDTTATCYYQNKDFIAGDHMVVLRAKWLNQKRGLFVRTLFAKESVRYCYGRAFRMDLIKNTLLKLPIQRDNKGKPIVDNNYTYSNKGYVPDWQFMEDYIDSLPYSDRLPV